MEGMTLERLQVIIEAQTRAYYEELQKVQQQTKKATSAVERQTEKIKSAFGKIGKAVAVAFSVTALISFGKSCIELGSALAEVQNVVMSRLGPCLKQSTILLGMHSNSLAYQKQAPRNTPLH